MLFVLLAVLEQFLNHISRHQLFSEPDKVLLAVSGGMDSMVMLDLFREAGFKIAVAHCNFRLRGSESDGDENFVHEQCKKNGVPFFVQHFETSSFAATKKISIQTAARELRYDWFNDLLKRHSFTKIATAHHFGDSMETILMHLTQGNATEGLVGIPIKNGNVIRPILFSTRDQIERYAREKNILWREDKSNTTDDYQRNFVRHHIIPKLKELNPSLEATWQQGVEKLEGDLALIQKAFAEWKREYVHETEGRISILKKGFDNFSSSGALLWRFVRSYGFNYDQAKEIINVLYRQPGKRFLSNTHELIIDRDEIIIIPLVVEWQTVTIEKHLQQVSLGPWQMQLSQCDGEHPGTDNMEVTLDGETVQFPLTWRRWRNGDAFYPLGMKGKKKLSDFLIDNKVSVADKNDVTVLESAGKIIYVVGWRIDDRFKLTALTKRVLRIKVTKN